MAQYEEAHKEHINKYKMAHCIGVAEYMRDNAAKYGLDCDVMYTMGLLHDIGYLEGRRGHESAGYEIAKKLGMSEQFCNAILYHGTSPYTLSNSVLNNAVLALVYEADMSINAQGFLVGFDKRLKDIGERYGYDHIAYKTASDTVDYVKSINKQLEAGINPFDAAAPQKKHNNDYER